MSHACVVKAAIVGVVDENQLTKPWAYVVLKEEVAGDEALAQALEAHVKKALPLHKYPRHIVFMRDLPKTATGKIQRFRLRELAAKEAPAAASA